jgi:hypothetical protein
MVAYYHSSQTLRARVLELGHEVHMWSEGLITFALGRMIPLQFRRDQNLQDWGGSSRIREELSARKRQGSMRNLTTTNSGLRNRLKKVMRISNLEVSGWPPPPLPSLLYWILSLTVLYPLLHAAEVITGGINPKLAEVSCILVWEFYELVLGRSQETFLSA